MAEAQAFIDRYEVEYGPWSLPIIAGVLPLYNGRHADFLHNEVPGINIPADIRQRIRQAGKDEAQTGLTISTELIDQFRPFVHGIYLVPAFGRYDLTAELIEAVMP